LFALWPALKYESNCDSVLAIAVGSDESAIATDAAGLWDERRGEERERERGGEADDGIRTHDLLHGKQTL
jgi:hypothetical protein